MRIDRESLERNPCSQAKWREESTNMDNISNLNKLESIKAFQSTINKSNKALAQMTQKGANTTLLKKRLKALYIGLAC